MPSLANLTLVAVGGAIGSILRYGITTIGGLSASKGLGTMTVNIIGCLCIGVLFAVFSHKNIADGWRLLLFTGLLGGFTTFSSFCLDAVTLSQDSALRAVVYVIVTNLAGIAAALMGIYVTNVVFRSLQ